MSDAARISDEVDKIVREEVVSRFRRLTADAVSRKADGELVTQADIRAEARISDLLSHARPGSIVIGEEAVDRRPDLLRSVSGPSVWIVDPVDSTMNFCNGDPNFSTLISWCENGEIIESWTFMPMRDQIAYARKGEGAFINGRRVIPRQADRKRPIITVTHPWFQDEDDRFMFRRLSQADWLMRASRGAGIEYVSLAEGETDALVFTWEKVWDHAAGILFSREAGALFKTRDGSAFRLEGKNCLPLIGSTTEAVAARIIDLLCATSPQRTARRPGSDSIKPRLNQKYGELT